MKRSDMPRFIKLSLGWIGLLLLLTACYRSPRLDGTAAATPTAASQAIALVQTAAVPPPPATATTTATAVPAETSDERRTTTDQRETMTAAATAVPTATPTATATPTPTPTPLHPLMIEVMRQESYPGSELIFEQTLAPGGNYDRYIVSYLSEGHKIYALLTVPWGQRPPTGWPVIIFNHGYIPPAEYRTTERYVAYVDGFARNGYIVFRSDYRGHGSSEGEATGGYSTPAYTIDV